jgi:hypothetical protein
MGQLVAGPSVIPTPLCPLCTAIADAVVWLELNLASTSLALLPDALALHFVVKLDVLFGFYIIEPKVIVIVRTGHSLLLCNPVKYSSVLKLGVQ